MNSRVLVILGCYVFAVLGLNIAVMGPSLQSLATQTNSPIEAFGYLFTAVSAGYLISAPLISILGKRLSTRAMLSAPVVLIGAMLLVTLSTSLTVVLIGALLLGFGQSITQVGYTALLGMRFKGQPNGDATINRVNAFYGIGALIGPVIVSASYRLTGGASSAFWIAIALSATILVLGLRVRLTPPPAESATAANPVQRNVLSSPIFLMMAATMAVYVGVEVAFSGWTTEFTKRATLVDVAQASFASSMFFAGMALSRYFANLLLRWLQPTTLVTAMLVLSTAGLCIMILPGASFFIALLGSGLIGFGLGPVYPTLVALAMQRFPQAARLTSSYLTSAGSIGAITAPPIVGGFIAGVGTLNTGWLVLAGLNALCVLIWLLTVRSIARIPVSLGELQH